MTQLYASLTGPLLGLYFPCPKEIQTEDQFRKALNSSKLKNLWCGIYTKEDAEEAIDCYGGQLLPQNQATRLDYNHAEVFHA